jgi:hypothetical protein
MAALALAPLGVFAKSQFLRPRTNRLMVRSLRLLSFSSTPSFIVGPTGSGCSRLLAPACYWASSEISAGVDKASWIAYYNEHLTKAYNWKFDGKLLQT